MNQQYQAGADAANRALDRSTLDASEMLQHWRAAEQLHRMAERYDLAEYAKGAGDMIQEFLDEKGDERG